MRSIKFPKMFNSNSTQVWKSTEYLSSTKQNTILLLQTEKGELFGDPYFGLMLRRYLYEPNSYVLKDFIIDTVYEQLSLFVPQVHVERRDIDIVQDRRKGVLYCTFRGINQIDYQPNTYDLILYKEEDNAQQ